MALLAQVAVSVHAGVMHQCVMCVVHLFCVFGDIWLVYLQRVHVSIPATRTGPQQVPG